MEQKPIRPFKIIHKTKKKKSGMARGDQNETSPEEASSEAKAKKKIPL
jgi:hypothetical protein